MSAANQPNPMLPTIALPPWRVAMEIALVFAVFFLHGAWPVPDVNETCYLIKAQHYWNPQAFHADFFAGTGDAHGVFYGACGWLTTLPWPLSTVAWVGRIFTWLLLAAAWRGLSWAIIPRPWLAILAAELFVLLTEQMHMAGEWMIGGFEAKGFAWAFVLWGLTAAVQARWNLAWLLMGAATALHVVVGGWSGICLAVVWLCSRRDRITLPRMLPGLAGSLLLAAPGLWPAIELNCGADSQTVQEANRIQVFERLPHHLLPSQFAPGYVPRHLLLWAVFLLLCWAMAADESQRRLRRFVLAAMALALVGFALAAVAAVAPAAAANLLRFYWSRMSDILVPLGVALLGLSYLVQLSLGTSRTARWIWFALLIVAAVDLSNQIRHLPSWPSQWGAAPSRTEKFTQAADWLDVCRWIADPHHTPTEAVFLTPYRSSSFKWYTGRSEVVNWKDMPQDAASIVEWWRRMNQIHATGNNDPLLRWHDSLAELGSQRLNELATQYGAQYAVVDLLPGAPRLAMQPLYENPSYAVYRVGK